MALFKVFKGVKNNLPSLSSSSDGYCYFTTDDGMFYIDYKNANGVLERKALNANDAKTLLGASLETVLTESDKKVPTSKAVLTKIGEVEQSVAAINSALSGKQATITGAATTVTGSNLTASRVLVSDSSGKIAASSSVTTTELGYLDGVTSKIQTQLDAKAPKTEASTSAAGLMSSNDKTKLNYTNIAYGTCSTAADVAAKVITISGNAQWTLSAGSFITVIFSATNTASNPTFNVNGTGAKNVYYTSSQITTSNLSYAGYKSRPMNFMYDGTQYRFIGWGVDTNSDTKVTQATATTTAGEYPVILGYSTSTSSVTNTVNKASTLTYNPNTKVLTAPTFKGALSGNASTATSAASATKATQDASGNVITSTYETKSDASDKLAEAKTYADTAANTVKNDLLNGAGAAYDTLVELGALIDTNKDAIDALEAIAAGKQATITGAATTITGSNLTASRALISNSSGKVAVSDVTSTELGYLDGVTSAIQTQLNAKSSSTHKHTVSHTPAGTVSKPTFTGTEATISTEYTPVGTVSKPTFTGSEVTSGTPAGTTPTSTVASSTHTHKYTPAGTVSKPTFTGSAVTSEAPSGTTTVYSITDVGTLPSCTYTAPSASYTAPSLSTTVENHCLKLTFSPGSHSFNPGSHSFSAGKLPTKGSGVSVATGTHTHSVTAAGSVSQPTFTGTEASTTSITGTTSVASSTHTHKVTASGSVSQPTFTGTKATISTKYTPAGSVSQPTFTGTAATLTSGTPQ